MTRLTNAMPISGESAPSSMLPAHSYSLKLARCFAALPHRHPSLR